MPYLMPVRVKRVSPRQTDIAWNDGHFSSYPSWYLRENCPCASCVEEFTGRRLILQGSIPGDLERIERRAGRELRPQVHLERRSQHRDLYV